jgi:hypothetical protein
MNRVVVSVMLIVGVSLSATSAQQESGALGRFAGNWSCKGNFTANGAPIAADLSIQPDERSGALIVRHDDVPPNSYHALEIWTLNKTGMGARAAISDKYSGMRWFESPGWVGSTLTWTRLEDGIAAEQFAYEFKGENLKVEWSIARNGNMTLGDTILCRRA